MTIVKKYNRLKRKLASYKDAVIAFSGGCDSTFLLAACLKAMPGRVVAVTADSPTLPRSELRDAKRYAKLTGARHIIIATKECAEARFVKNDRERCYWCKKELFRELKRVRKKLGFSVVFDGTVCDDARDYRPGSRAKSESGVESPLKEAGFGKTDVRKMSRALKLPTWNKPPCACLASRIPYGTPISDATLRQVERAERRLMKAGFRHVRVRHHGDIARIEVPPTDRKKIIEYFSRPARVDAFKKEGFKYISVDVEGYRTGSLNEALK